MCGNKIGLLNVGTEMYREISSQMGRPIGRPICSSISIKAPKVVKTKTSQLNYQSRLHFGKCNIAEIRAPVDLIFGFLMYIFEKL